MEKIFPRWHRGGQAAREEFMARVPQARERPFVRADLLLLLAAAEQHNMETASEVLRLRGLSLMLRNMPCFCTAGIDDQATEPLPVPFVPNLPADTSWRR